MSDPELVSGEKNDEPQNRVHSPDLMLNATEDELRGNRKSRRIPHPFHFRLPVNSIFPVDYPNSLVGTGFTSMALGIITSFRPTPLLLLKVINDTPRNESDRNVVYSYGPYVIYTWLIFILLILFAGGVLMTFSGKIKKRGVLAIHPWSLLFLYFDPFFWLSLSIYLQIEATTTSPAYIDDFTDGLVYFTFVYLDIVLFTIMHYLFASYFIVAQLTVIEKFY